MTSRDNDQEFPPGNSADQEFPSGNSAYLASALRALGAEPPAGFEARLLERLAAAPCPRRFHSGVAALALCAALASALVLILIVRSPLPPHAVPSPRAAARTVAPVQPRLAAQPARVARVAAIYRPKSSSPARLRPVARRHFPAQFPTPTPPSPSELALLRFARTAPPVVAAFAAAPDLRPIKIAAIEIAPLSIPPLGEFQK